MCGVKEREAAPRVEKSWQRGLEIPKRKTSATITHYQCNYSLIPVRSTGTASRFFPEKGKFHLSEYHHLQDLIIYIFLTWYPIFFFKLDISINILSEQVVGNCDVSDRGKDMLSQLVSGPLCPWDASLLPGCFLFQVSVSIVKGRPSIPRSQLCSLHNRNGLSHLYRQLDVNSHYSMRPARAPSLVKGDRLIGTRN